MVRQHIAHEVRGQHGLDHDQAQQEPAAVRAGGMPFAFGIGTVVQRVPGLGHGRAAQHAAPGIAQPAGDNMRRPLARHHRAALGLGAGVDLHGAVFAPLQQRCAIHLGIAVCHRETPADGGVGTAALRGRRVLGRQARLQARDRVLRIAAVGGNGDHGGNGCHGRDRCDRRRGRAVCQQFAAHFRRYRQAVDIALACRRLGRSLL
ncbi:hypothetical protein D9M72_435180 [compost metagenome]